MSGPSGMANSNVGPLRSALVKEDGAEDFAKHAGLLRVWVEVDAVARASIWECCLGSFFAGGKTEWQELYCGVGETMLV